jgi:hypothetical protein
MNHIVLFLLSSRWPGSKSSFYLQRVIIIHASLLCAFLDSVIVCWWTSIPLNFFNVQRTSIPLNFFNVQRKCWIFRFLSAHQEGFS